MKKILLFFIICAFNISISQNKDTTKVQIYDPKANPQSDLSIAIKKAQKSNKKILLEVGGDWCPWCKKLNKLFNENKEIANLLNKYFIVLKVNYSKENKNQEFLSKYPKIEGYPHIFILNKNGELLHSQNTGDLESGDHHDPDKVIKFLKEWSKAKN
ncbi:MAG TPA: thioredoxin family protein [Bacteroidota bacterium]|jgi:thioredoxin-related protein|nr:thioredoxin family protein [Bacteroidota bacterium]